MSGRHGDGRGDQRRRRSSAAEPDTLNGVGHIEAVVGQHHAAVESCSRERIELDAEDAALGRVQGLAGGTARGIRAAQREVGGDADLADVERRIAQVEQRDVLRRAGIADDGVGEGERGWGRRRTLRTREL